MRYLISGLCALAVLASPADAAAAPVVYCGVVKANSITSGQGSGPRTFELDVTSGPGGGGRFSVPESIVLPTIGSYICGQFEQGVPMNGLAAVLRSGDAGYVQQATVTTAAPIASAPQNVPAATPAGSLFTLGFIELLLASLAVLIVGGLMVVRNRRASAI